MYAQQSQPSMQSDQSLSCLQEKNFAFLAIQNVPSEDSDVVYD